MDQGHSKYLTQITTSYTQISLCPQQVYSVWGVISYSKIIYSKGISRTNIVWNPIAVLETLTDGHLLSLMVYSLFVSASGLSSAFLGCMLPRWGHPDFNSWENRAFSFLTLARIWLLKWSFQCFHKAQKQQERPQWIPQVLAIPLFVCWLHFVIKMDYPLQYMNYVFPC